MKSKTEIEAGQIFAALRKQPGLIARELEVLLGKIVTSTLTQMERYQLVRRVKTRAQKSDVAKKTYVFEYHAVGKIFTWPDMAFRRARDTLLKRPPKASATPLPAIVNLNPISEPVPAQPAPVFHAQLPIREIPDTPCPRAAIIGRALALPVGELILLRRELNSRIAELVA